MPIGHEIAYGTVPIPILIIKETRDGETKTIPRENGSIRG